MERSVTPPKKDLLTEDLAPDAEGIARAAAILRDGGLVAFPTETVYGLGADASSDTAVAAIYAAKGRPSFNPLIVHVADLAAAEQIALFSETARKVAAAFWPGALTLVLPLRGGARVSDLVTAGLPTVAIRMPDHPLPQDLLHAFGGGVAAPSANLSGRISPTRADHVRDGLAGRVDAILDGGPCQVGVESTILSLAGDTPRILRPGGVTVEALTKVLGAAPQTGSEALDPADAPTAPGQLASHYAPNAAMRLNATHRKQNEIWLGFGPESADADLNLSPAGDLDEAAAGLFTALRTLDLRAEGRRIAVAPIPERGIGVAINDRLRRAAAPKEVAT